MQLEHSFLSSRSHVAAIQTPGSTHSMSLPDRIDLWLDTVASVLSPAASPGWASTATMGDSNDNDNPQDNDDLDLTPRNPRSQSRPVRTVAAAAAAFTNTASTTSQQPNDNDDVFTGPSASASSSTAPSFTPAVSATPSQRSRRRPTSPLKRSVAETYDANSDVSATHHHHHHHRRRTSPTKRVKTRGDLARLQCPVRFDNVVAKELPDDARRLYMELRVADSKHGILPRALEDVLDDDERLDVLPTYWEDGTDPTLESREASNLHSQVKMIVSASRECARRSRSEAAWNARVHDPALCLLLSDFPAVQPELITTARIAHPFQPLFQDSTPNLPPPRDDDADVFAASSGRSPSRSVSSANTSTATNQQQQGSWPASAHNMVDFALVLDPDTDRTLASAVDTFLSGSDFDYATVNQTTYLPLCRDPAPIAIETKTAAGSSEAARLQLGTWTAAYHRRLRAMRAELLERRRNWEQVVGAGEGGVDVHKEAARRVITLPLVHWLDGEWRMSFAVDKGGSIDILAANLSLGDVNTVMGMYQLRKTLACLARWMEGQFKPWFIDWMAVF